MSDGHAPVPRPAIAHVARALKHRNYRLFFAGQGLSLIGTWMTRIASSWLVYRLTGSALLLGMVGFVAQIPTFLLAPVAGVWLDRVSRYRVLVATQVLAMLQSGLLAWFALRGTISVVHIGVLSALQGVINAVEMPARQSFVVELIEDRADLPNAIALNSTMVNVARLLGPTIAGWLITFTGEGICFAVDAASYLAVIGSLLAMSALPSRTAGARRALLVELGEGFRYATGFAPIRLVLGLLVLVSLLGVPYMVLMPAIAREVFKGGAHTLGILTAANGLGAMFGALHLAARRNILGLPRVLAVCAIAFGASLVAFAASRTLLLSLPLLMIAGSAMMVQMAASNTLLQSIVDEDKRGRLMSFYSMAFFGPMPIGSLFAGFLAERIGVMNTIAAGGVPCLIGGLLFLRQMPKLNAQLRPIYVRLGLLSKRVSARASEETPA